MSAKKTSVGRRRPGPDRGRCRSPAASCRRAAWRRPQSETDRRRASLAPSSTPHRWSVRLGQRPAGHGRAGGADDPAPVGVAAVHAGLDQRRVGDGPGDLLGLSLVFGARPPTSRMILVAPSPSATIIRAMRRSMASRAAPRRRSPSAPGLHAGSAAAQEQHRVVGAHLAVDRHPVERAVDAPCRAAPAYPPATPPRRWSPRTAWSPWPARSCRRPWRTRPAAPCPRAASLPARTSWGSGRWS